MESLKRVVAGLQQSLIPEVQAYWLENPRWAPDRELKPELSTPEPPKRRYSKKGQASGSIKERIGNKKRKHPSVSYFY